jgi:hypothetical protein
LLSLILAGQRQIYNYFAAFSNVFSAILNEFLNYFHICFNYVTSVQKQKSPLRSFLFAVGGEVSAEHPSGMGLIQLSAEAETG